MGTGSFPKPVFPRAPARIRSYFLFEAAAFCAAQRFLSAATILALPSGLNPLFFFAGFAAGAAPLIFAHRALAAADILALAEALIVLRPFLTGAGFTDGNGPSLPPPRILFSCASSLTISSLIEMACLSWLRVMFIDGLLINRQVSMQENYIVTEQHHEKNVQHAVFLLLTPPLLRQE